MYERFFGLRERPFDLSSDLRFLVLSGTHRETLTHLQLALTGTAGLTVVTGEVGTGKTTLIRAALHSMAGRDVTAIHLANPVLTRDEFFDFLASGFSLGPDAAVSKSVFLRALQRRLQAQARHAVLALIVDEAQRLTDDLLEELRLLTNCESDDGRTIAIALVGQPEFADRLNRPDLRQLKQRVALRCELHPLDLAETATYIAGRVSVAGGRPADLFSREAIIEIYERSAGLPRTISVLCHNALVIGLAADAKRIDRDIVLEVCRDLDVRALTAHPGVTPLDDRARATNVATPAPQPPTEGQRPSLLKTRTPMART